MTKEVKAMPGENPPSRKTYSGPQLVVYGNISRITQTVDNMGKADGGMGMFDKT